MADNRKAFDDAMRAGSDAAWDGQWDKATLAYQRALGESRDDVGALTGLGLTYSNTNQLEKALECYQTASALAPDNPGLLERVGRVREQLGHDKPAAEAYMAAAEQHLSHAQTVQVAVARWHDAVRVHPDHIEARVKLLQYFQRQGQFQEAVQQCLALARTYWAKGQPEHAIQICEHAVKLSPRDPQVLALLESLRYGRGGIRDSRATTASESPDQLAAAGRSTDSRAFDQHSVSEVEVPDERGSPIDITRQRALTDLAESFFEEESASALPAETDYVAKAKIDGQLGRAMDFQTRGKIDAAISAYEKVLEAGSLQPAVHFNLGLLYQEKLHFDEAIDQFERSVTHPEYGLGSHFALGECYRALGRIDDALEHFVEVLKIVDLATVRREQVDDLTQLYEHLADGYIAQGNQAQALEFTSSLVGFLSEHGWEDKIVQARRRLDALSEEGPTLSLAEMLEVQDSERILEAVALSQEYVMRDMLHAALEECYYALGRAPSYLPIHRQIAQVLLAMEDTEAATAKYVVIADTYRTRGTLHQAKAMFQHALKLSPMNTTVRRKLIDTLVSHGEIDEALENYLILASSHYQLAQMEKALEVYQEALRLAPRGSGSRQWSVRILHSIGDIDMQRVDWRRAISVYEQIRQLDPDDERACLTLFELHYRLNRLDLAMGELDHLLAAYTESGKNDRIFAILEDAVQEHPEDIPLLTRLAQAYLDSGHIEQALRHLDSLGDLQIESERYEDAVTTIQAIIALNPPDAAAFRELLDQLNEQLAG